MANRPTAQPTQWPVRAVGGVVGGDRGVPWQGKGLGDDDQAEIAIWGARTTPPFSAHKKTGIMG